MKSVTRFLKPLALSALCLAGTLVAATAPTKKILLVTGQSNPSHDWTKSSPLVKTYLEQTGLFTVDVATAPATGVETSDFNPKFSDYAAVVFDYEAADWPAATKKSFEEYMKNGGGLVTIHAADNAFPRWPEFNEMIGVGGWGMGGGRTAAAGPKIRWVEGKMVLDETPGGPVGTHPRPHDFPITTRAPDHPIMKGLPAVWLHAKDELYGNLRGPAKNVTVLATGHADPAFSQNGGDDPTLMAISYGKGRVFHSTLGHVSKNSVVPYLPLTCVGFIVTLQRGTEWAATGNVTQKVPADFPTAEKTSNRNPAPVEGAPAPASVPAAK